MDEGISIRIYKSTGLSKLDCLVFFSNIASKINELIRIPELNIRQIDGVLKQKVLKRIVERLILPYKDKNIVNFLCNHIREMECWASQTYENMFWYWH